MPKKRPSSRKKKASSGHPGALNPWGVNLLRVFLVLALVSGAIGAFKAKATKPRTHPAPIPPTLSQEGPAPSYVSQKFRFEIDGIPNLRGLSGFGDAPRLDRNVLGNVLKVRGKEYAKGIGSQAASEIVFDLSGKVRRFTCLAGVDEGGGGAASLVFVVKADGKKVFESPLMRADSDPLPIDLDVTGVKELSLVLDPAGHPDWDHGNWLDLRFKKGRP